MTVETFTNEMPKDDRGLPVFAVVERSGEKLYKADGDLSANDCRQAAEYHKRLAEHHAILADYYTLEAENRQF